MCFWRCAALQIKGGAPSVQRLTGMCIYPLSDGWLAAKGPLLEGLHFMHLSIDFGVHY